MGAAGTGGPTGSIAYSKIKAAISAGTLPTNEADMLHAVAGMASLTS